MSFKIVYTANDDRFFMLQLYKSLSSLSKFVDKEYIDVIFNPEITNKRNRDKIEQYANAVSGSTYADKIDLPPFRYKYDALCIDTDELIFLDCDTIVLKDVTELLDGDYDFFAREEPCRSVYGEYKPTWNETTWLENLRKKEYTIPFNDGFMIFKNRTHNKIKFDFIDNYLLYYNKVTKSPNEADDSHLNEFALSLAVADYKCKIMTDKEHWYGWRPEMYKEKPYVLHIGTGWNNMETYTRTLQRYHV